MSFFQQNDCIFHMLNSPKYQNKRTQEYFKLKNEIDKWLSLPYVNNFYKTNREYCISQYETIINILMR